MELLGKPVGPTDPVPKGPVEEEEEAPVGADRPLDPVPEALAVPVLVGPRLNEYG